jgi:hypothetical protein
VAVNAPNWDSSAIRAGGAVALVVAAPTQIAARWALDSDRSGLAFFLSLVSLLGFWLGAALAAWVQRLGLPLAHGLVTAIGTFVLVQVVLVPYRLIADSELNWFSIVFSLTLTSGAGLLGGATGQRLRSRGFVPSHERSMDTSTERGEHP